jgi:hypothetical protein
MIGVLALCGVFSVTMVRAIFLRSETTYNYPAYSSLNNAEKGTKAYFDALTRLGFVTSRNYRPLAKLVNANAAILYAGPALQAFRFSDEKELRQFEQLAKGGARVVLAFDPEGSIMGHPAKPKPGQKPDGRERKDNLSKRWGVELKHSERAVPAEMRDLLGALELQPVYWQFSSWSGDWTPSQLRNGTPIFLERRFGRGSVLLIGNSKLFTNRELLTTPDSAALAAVTGAYRNIIFDESHLGLQETGTVMALAIRHRLEWMLVGFAALAILYLWRSSVSFVPRVSVPVDAAISGRDAHTALSNLLMQSVPAAAVLRVSAEEWNRCISMHGRSAGQTFSTEDLAGLGAVTPEHAVSQYRAIANRLNSRVRTNTLASL